MEFKEILEQYRFEYHAWLAANYQDNQAPRLLDTSDAPSFYDYLLSRGLSRQQLSSHGIGRDKDEQSYTGPRCRHGLDPNECTPCSAAISGSRTWRACRHGYDHGKCPTCDRDSPQN